jgi:primosomal protein N' (replication factor Y)
MLAPEAIIQTHLPENNLIKYLGATNYELFFENELVDRAKFNYPPFAKLIMLTYKNSDEKICQEISTQVAQKLKQIAEDEKIQTNILGPFSTHTAKKQTNFLYQIIIKQTKSSKMINNYLQNLPKGWSINVDPFDIA